MRECRARELGGGHGERGVRDVRLDRPPSAGSARPAVRGSAAAPAGGGRGGGLLLSPGRASRHTARHGAVALGIPGRLGPAYAAHSPRVARLPPASLLPPPTPA